MLKQAYIFASGAFTATAISMLLMGANGSPSYEGAVVRIDDLATFNAKCREGYEVKAATGDNYYRFVFMQKKVR